MALVALLGLSALLGLFCSGGALAVVFVLLLLGWGVWVDVWVCGWVKVNEAEEALRRMQRPTHG